MTPGRPRDPLIDAALQQHLVPMLVQCGPDGFSVDDLASRCGVSKAAIYRRYRGREELIAAGFAAVNETMPDVSDLPLREALIAHLEWVKGAVGSALTASWLVAIQQRPQLYSQYMATVVAPRREALARIVRRGQQQGQIAEAADLDVILTCLSAPAVLAGMHRAGPHPAQRVSVADVVDTVLAGILSPAARATGS